MKKALLILTVLAGAVGLHADGESTYPKPSVIASEIAAFFGDGIPSGPRFDQMIFLNQRYRGFDEAGLRRDIEAKIAATQRFCSLVGDPAGNLRFEMHFDYVIDGRKCRLDYGAIFIMRDGLVDGVTNFERAEPIADSKTQS